MRHLPHEAVTTRGSNRVWWAGQSRASLTNIFENSMFMNEAHIYGFANRLERTIVTVDVREPALVLSKYVPSYEVQPQLSMREAVQLRNSSEQPIWVLLEPSHFSALALAKPAE